MLSGTEKESKYIFGAGAGCGALFVMVTGGSLHVHQHQKQGRRYKKKAYTFVTGAVFNPRFGALADGPLDHD